LDSRKEKVYATPESKGKGMKNDKKEETMEDFLRCVKKDRRPWLHPISPFERLRLKIEIGKMLEKGEEEEGFLSSVLLYLAMKNPSSPLPEIPLLVLKQQAKKGDKPSLFLLGLLAERGILPGVNEEEAFPFFLLSGLRNPWRLSERTTCSGREPPRTYHLQGNTWKRPHRLEEGTGVSVSCFWRKEKTTWRIKKGT
jgi:hypothetical protein